MSINNILLERLKRDEGKEILIPTTVRMSQEFKQNIRTFAEDKKLELAELYRVCLELGLDQVKRELAEHL